MISSDQREAQAQSLLTPVSVAGPWWSFLFVIFELEYICKSTTVTSPL